MKISSYNSSIQTIDCKHPAFRITDGLITTPRAGFEINQSCPKEYRLVLQECIKQGWLKPIAYMTKKEITLYGLSNN